MKLYNSFNKHQKNFQKTPRYSDKNFDKKGNVKKINHLLFQFKIIIYQNFKYSISSLGSIVF